MAAKSYEALEVWQKAHRLVLEVYRVSRAFPREEVYALTSQMRRAAGWAANIVEGFRRPTKAGKARFYRVAPAPLDEAHYHLRFAHDLDYADTSQLRGGFEEAGRMLNAYTQAVIASDRPRRDLRTYGLAGAMIGGLSYFFSLLAPRF